MLHIPILRHGQPYESIDRVDIVHHATGAPVAAVSQANSGMITRDIHRMEYNALERFTMAELIEKTKQAGEFFINEPLPIGDQVQTFEDYVRDLSATTGMPIAYCRTNARKIYRIFSEIDRVIAGLTRGFDLSILDRGYGEDKGRTLSYYRDAKVFGAVLPSNSPGRRWNWKCSCASTRVHGRTGTMTTIPRR